MKKTLTILFIGILLIGCATAKRNIRKTAQNTFASAFYDNQFTGFLLLDPESKDTLYAHNSNKYFTPASNTKIFTLYAAMQLLPDSIPALKYSTKNDTIFAEGTGDPSFLHSYFKDSTVQQFLSDHQNIALGLNNFQDDKFGPGWSWGDYQYYYQPERTPFPLYGNVVTLHNSNTLHVQPSYFTDSVVTIDFSKNREPDKNIFYYAKSRQDTVEIPYRTDAILTKNLLERELGKKITLTKNIPEGKKTVLYSIPSDSMYKRMMVESDNFLSEQLLILASSTLSDTLSSEKSRNYVLENHLSDLNQEPRWVDGSGLSRYNLFTPESIVYVLHKMYREIERERLFNLFPAGGVSGTLENWYDGRSKPYIYAKSGSLGNNYCLSGYLITKSGKTLVFSFMNNHFRHPSAEVKKNMQRVLEFVRDTY